MTAATADTDVVAASPPSFLGVVSIWARHLLSLWFPLSALAFLWTGPHPWWMAPLFMLPMVAAHQLDVSMRAERRQPAESLPAWPFDLLVYTLTALHFLVIFEVLRLFTVQSFFSVDMIFVHLLVGSASGFSIITAHELIHRKKPWEQQLGRLILCTVLYEHFYTEHLRGHHVRVGTDDDPATARFGESFEGFFRRTVPAQFRSAWKLEKERLGDTEMGLLDRRMLGNRILHGFAVEGLLMVVALVFFGWASLFAFVLQAVTAVRLLEAVNYFEHWGLMRRGRRVRTVDSWDTHAWFTYYGLIGLSRHADHHAWPARPYQQLRVWQDAPLLPAGYVATVDMVMADNRGFQEQATAELARRRLGPFEDGSADPESAGEALAAAQRELAGPRAERPPSSLGRAWKSLPIWGRVGLVLSLIAALTTAGVQWETGAAAPLAMFGLHFWNLVIVTGGIIAARRLKERWGVLLPAFALGLGGIALVGWLTQSVVLAVSQVG